MRLRSGLAFCRALSAYKVASSSWSLYSADAPRSLCTEPELKFVDSLELSFVEGYCAGNPLTAQEGPSPPGHRLLPHARGDMVMLDVLGL